jgi:hypothetical protein
MHKWRYVLLFLPVFIMSMMQPGQDRDTRSRFQALYIYNFTSLIDWPKEFKSGNFKIGIFGETNLYNDLSKSYTNKLVGSQAIKVYQFSKTSEIEDCHILFIARDKSDNTAELAKKYRSKSTLIITEKEKMLKEGAIINFIVKNNKVAYEVSKGNASRHKLTLGSQLLNLAAYKE